MLNQRVDNSWLKKMVEMNLKWSEAAFSSQLREALRKLLDMFFHITKKILELWVTYATELYYTGVLSKKIFMKEKNHFLKASQ